MLQDKAQSESLRAKTASAEVISTNSGGGDSETDAPVLLDKPASVPLKARRVLGGTTSEERLKEIRETFELHKAFSRDRHESKVQRVSTHTAACSATGSEKGVSTGADSSLPDETGPEPGIAMSPKEFKNFQGHREKGCDRRGRGARRRGRVWQRRVRDRDAAARVCIGHGGDH